MSFAFALPWAQRAHENILQKAGVLRTKQLLVDFAPAPDVAEPAQVIYVDNGVFACTVTGLATSSREAAQ